MSQIIESLERAQLRRVPAFQPGDQGAGAVLPGDDETQAVDGSPESAGEGTPDGVQTEGAEGAGAQAPRTDADEAPETQGAADEVEATQVPEPTDEIAGGAGD